MKRAHLAAAALLAPLSAWPGAFTFTEQELNSNQGAIGPFPDLVTHPQNYDPNTGGPVTVRVCVAAGQDPNLLEVALRNIVDRYNLFVPVSPNLRTMADSEPASNEIDWESVALHEIGHCMGLNHPNAASESCSDTSTLCGPTESSNYTKALPGPGLPLFNVDGQQVNTEAFDAAPGDDGVIGSPDDVRGDDVNLHYFEIGVNNPFVVPDIVDSMSYSRDPADLPAGDAFAANADFDVGQSVYGVTATEAVMQQGTFPDETQRALAADDVATLRYARSGVDRVAGTGDDYTVTLVYSQNVSRCDIQVDFDSSQTGFAVCQTSTNQIDLGDESAILTTANAFFAEGVNWFFSQTRIPMPGADQAEVIPGGSTSTVNGGATSLLDNDENQETGGGSSGLVVSTSTFGGPEHGSVTLNSDGTFSYTHNGDMASEDRFVYEVCVEGEEACSHQYVGISITAPTNNAPIAVGDMLEVEEGGTATVLVGNATSVLDNDSDPDGDILTVSTTPTSDPANGNVILDADGTFVYTHDGSETTTDSFGYEVCDDGTPQACAEATVDVTITLNDPPQPGDDAITVDEGGTATALDGGASSVLANDSDPEGDNLAVSPAPVTGPANGTLTLNMDGTFEYIHDGSETTSDSFAYEVCDDGTESECAQATVSITVNPVNDAPTAVDDTVVVNIGGTATTTIEESASLLANDVDADSANLAAAKLTDPASGTATVNADGTFSYTHTGMSGGTDSFDYEVCDDATPSACATGTVSVTIAPPFAQCTRIGRRAVVGVPISIDVASEFAGTGLTFSATGLPASLSVDGGIISGTPVADDVTNSPFTVTVSASDGTDQTFVLEVEATADAVFFSSFEGLCFGL